MQKESRLQARRDSRQLLGLRTVERQQPTRGDHSAQAQCAELSRLGQFIRQPGRGLHEDRAEAVGHRELQEVPGKGPDERQC